MPNYKSIISLFLHSAEKLKIVSSEGSDSLRLSLHYLIFDSSFNPPHKGHVSVIETTINYYREVKNIENTAVVLMLSVNNADKVIPKPEPFDRRLRMMELLLDYIREKNKTTPVFICLAKDPMFAQKFNAFQDYLTLADTLSLQDGVSFLLGFDTLVRVFDPKYYLPGTIQQSLNTLIEKCNLICLARNESGPNFLTNNSASSSINAIDSNSRNYTPINNLLETQQEFLLDMKEGKIQGVPSEWSESIVILNPLKFDSKNGNFLSSLSSSEIRSLLKQYYNQKDQDEIMKYLNMALPDNIKDCILNERYYDN